MKKFFKKIYSNLSINVIGALIAIMLIFGAILSTVSYFSLRTAYRDEYSKVTYHMADSVTLYVNGDNLDGYLNGDVSLNDEYQETKKNLDDACIKLNVSLIYVIEVDRTDYGKFVSIFNSVNNEVDNSKYTPWELGFERKTSNEEYASKYRSLYEKESKYETVFRTKTTDGQHPHITTLVPVFKSNGDVAAILCMQRPMNEMLAAIRPYFIMITIIIAIMAIIIAGLIVLFNVFAIIRPIGKVSKEASRFAKESTVAQPLGKISRFEVLSNLASSIDSMEAETVKNIQELTSITAEKERIGAELSIATGIQRDSLPKVDNAFPNRKDFEIYASMDPAKEVGGDFYNFFLVDDDHLALVIADVSGKGIPAALFMMVSNILISDRTMMGGNPKEILEFVNDNLYAHNHTGMFVTVWLGILELSTGKLVSTNAGHENPVIYRNGRFTEVVEKHGFIVGGMGGVKYELHETKLNKGDKLFLYTDGLTEAMDINKRMYKIERAVKVLNENKDKSPKELLAIVKEDVNKFVGEAEQFDDLTMMCIELKK